VHGLITGKESRQQLYTMCTRGSLSNHIYLQLVGDGDPHTLIRPDTIRPSTATELLEQILARDDTPRSASTLRRERQDPAVRLGNSVERYLDALHTAAEKVIGNSATQATQAMQASADQLVPGLTDEPSGPTLHAHLLLLAAGGADRTNAPGRSRRQSSISYPRKRRTRTPQPSTPSHRPGTRPRRHPTSSHPCRARHRRPRSARVAETSHPGPPRRLRCVLVVCRPSS
jgi:hypothetical protein